MLFIVLSFDGFDIYSFLFLGEVFSFFRVAGIIVFGERVLFLI